MHRKLLWLTFVSLSTVVLAQAPIKPAAAPKNEHRVVTPSAKKTVPGSALPATNVVGSWPVVLYVPGNELRFQLDFQQQGDRVTGNLNTEVGSIPINSGSLKGNALSFTVTLFGNTYRFQGEVNGNELSGQWFASGPWKAVRNPARKP